MEAKATKEAVIAARKQLTEQQEKITPTAIHRITGGSKSTIYRILSELAEDDFAYSINKPDPAAENLVDEVTKELVSKIYNYCKKRADAIAIAEYKSKQDNEADVLKVLDKMDDIEAKYEAKELALTEKVKRFEAEIALLQEKLKHK